MTACSGVDNFGVGGTTNCDDGVGNDDICDDNEEGGIAGGSVDNLIAVVVRPRVERYAITTFVEGKYVRMGIPIDPSIDVPIESDPLGSKLQKDRGYIVVYWKGGITCGTEVDACKIVED